MYYQSSRTDPLYLKICVACIMFVWSYFWRTVHWLTFDVRLMETLNTVFMFHITYDYGISDFGNLLGVDTILWCVGTLYLTIRKSKPGSSCAGVAG